MIPAMILQMIGSKRTKTQVKFLILALDDYHQEYLGVYVLVLKKLQKYLGLDDSTNIDLGKIHTKLNKTNGSLDNFKRYDILECL